MINPMSFVDPEADITSQSRGLPRANLTRLAGSMIRTVMRLFGLCHVPHPRLRPQCGQRDFPIVRVPIAKGFHSSVESRSDRNGNEILGQAPRTSLAPPAI